MADNIETPVADGLLIATDEVTSDGDTAHAQFVKLMDGTQGSAQPLVIEDTGAIRKGMAVLEVFGMVTVTNAGGYTAGDVVGTPVDLGVYPRGVIPHMDLIVASPAGSPLPDLDVFIVQTAAGSVPADVGVDDAPFVPNLADVAAVLGANAASFAPLDINPNLLRWTTNTPARLTDLNSSDDPQWLLVLRAGSTFTDDLTDGVVVFGWAEHVRHTVVPSA